ncbi:MAG: indole-3-glycerol phosphate synthase TrpC [Paramuribaculum sp.]|nr:indole-3-glycerol phosphate synthase TrpC [Paramuribaculum sp.]
MADILQQIVSNKRREVEAVSALCSYSCCGHAKVRSMSGALSESATGIIAEFKRRSPSRGEIHPKALVEKVIPGYTKAGATACSVLTDTPFFGGAVTDLAVARSLTDIPLLRKDFIVSEFQIHEAAHFGADTILLIASVLTRTEIERFTKCAHTVGLEVLLELHSKEELDKFCEEVEMVGVNNRNLATFHTDPELSLKVARELPDNVVKIAESGLTSMDEVRRLRDVGYKGFLIGETFMREPDPGVALAQFLAR